MKIQNNAIFSVVFRKSIKEIENILANEDEEHSHYSAPKDTAKFIQTLKTLRKNNELRESWNRLQTWRRLSSETHIVNFFRVHCLIRNRNAQDILNAMEARSLEERRKDYISHFTIKEWAIEYSDIVNYSLGLTEYGIKSQTRHFLLASAESENRDTSVVKMFQETSLFNLEEVVQEDNKALQAGSMPMTDFSSWGLINQDLKYKEPVLYLRIDLNNYSVKVKNMIDKMIRDEKHKTRTKHIDFNSMETALMLHDLKAYFAKDALLFIIENTIDDMKDNIPARQTVNDCLDRATSLINSSITKKFPVFK